MAAVPGSYFEVRKVWRTGDVVDLDLEMEPRLIEANPLVEETLNQVAVQRGPVVYCLESADLPRGTRVMDVRLPENAVLRARYDERLLGGVVVLEWTGDGAGGDKLEWDAVSRGATGVRRKPVNLRLIPYFAWENRGEGEMTVWMKR